MVRTRVRWGRVAGLATAVVILVGGVTGAASAGSTHPEPRPHAAFRTYVVRPGDTLWSIATRIAGPQGDPRPVVDDIVAANGLGSVLAAGTTIRVPRG